MRTPTLLRGQQFVLVLLALFSSIPAQIVNFGPCSRSVTTVRNLDLDAYVGRWYEHSKYPFIFEFNAKCVYALYGKGTADGNLTVFNFDINRLTSRPESVNGTAVVVGPGKLTVKFQNMPRFLGGADYWVLGTDYKNYAVVYTCREFLGFLHTQVVWILTRERLPSQAIVDTARTVISANGISLEPLHETDQQNCPAVQ